MLIQFDAAVPRCGADAARSVAQPGGREMTRTVVPGRHRVAVLAAAAFMLCGLGLTGCGIANDAQSVASNVTANKALIDQFASTIKSGHAAAFEATYVTTGSSQNTIVYAVKPPDGLAFRENQSNGSGRLDIVANSSGEYACLPQSASGPGWSCQKLAAASAAVQNKIFEFYTPAHWVAFLRGFSLAAGFAGDKISSSKQTLNGFSMQCVDVRASGTSGTSKICSTAQGILGYVKVASDPDSFQLESYSAAPSASLFKLPPGAKITTPSQGSG
jgi:hypothetical protein